MRVQVYEDAAKQWRWRLIAENGRIVADGSEGYYSKSNAERGWHTVAKSIPEATFNELEPDESPDTFTKNTSAL